MFFRLANLMILFEIEKRGLKKFINTIVVSTPPRLPQKEEVIAKP